MSEKIKKLTGNGTLNPHPNRVIDIQFKTNHFFDADDLMQVKYEMLRRVHHEAWPITRATHEFGLSRPAFYQAQEAFKQSGLRGLLPQKRGPKQAHKLSKEIMTFIHEQRGANPKISILLIVKNIKSQFGICLHKRSVERALTKNQKKP